ncbi:MAG: hemolysin family protein [Anaerolineaceae bacterium]
MIDPLWYVLVLWIVLDLLFSAVRSSLLNARLPYLLNLKDRYPQAAQQTLNLIDHPRLRASMRLALVLLHFLAAGTGIALIVHSQPLFAPGSALALLAVAAVVLVMGEFLIEGWVLHDPEPLAIRTWWLGWLVNLLLTPFSAILVSLVGDAANPAMRLSSVTDDDLRTWVEEGQPEGTLEQGERKMIYSIFQFGDTLAREIMVPRIDILALDIHTSLQTAIEVLTRSGHSRVPVYEETVDNIIGFLYAKDLLRNRSDEGSLLENRDLLRPAYFVPETKKAEELLAEMQARRFHMAIVVDEYGGVAGLVTLEDIVEEIIGEVRDEYDQSEELLYTNVGPQEYIFQGKIALNDFNELMGTHLNTDVSDTLAGYIYGEIGRVPGGGEKITVENVELTVEQVLGQRIRKVRARRLQSDSTAETEKNHVEG